MPATSHLPTAMLLVIVPLILWRVVARVRRLVSRQALSVRRQRFALVLFPVLLAMLALGARAHPAVLAALAAGVAGGLALAAVGIARTRFEALPEGVFYTPNAPIGIAVSALFIGRILYRLAEVHAGESAQGFSLHSPLTLGLFGLLGGYYAGFAAGLLRWRRRHVADLAGS